jgi:hypothetical protein
MLNRILSAGSRFLFSGLLVLIYGLNFHAAEAGSKGKASSIPSPAVHEEKGAAAVSVTQSSDEKVWVKIEDGAISCDDPKLAHTLEHSQKALTDLNVKVFAAKAASDGKMRAAVCGIPKGNEHHFLILKKDLPIAIKRGFQLDSTGSSDAKASDSIR